VIDEAKNRRVVIVAEASLNPNRANFPLKSEAKKFEGRCSDFERRQKNLRYKSARHNALRQSSGLSADLLMIGAASPIESLACGRAKQ
jgi:hypothetical protein